MVSCHWMHSATPSVRQLEPRLPSNTGIIIPYLQHVMPSAPVALTDDFTPCTPKPCRSIWPTKQRSPVRLLLGWANIMHQKGCKGLFYISKKPLDNVILGIFLSFEEPRTLCFIFVFSFSAPR